MQMVKCVNGHWYDPEKSKKCPWCGKNDEKIRELKEQLGDPGRFRVRYPDDPSGEGKTEPLFPGRAPGMVTIGGGMTGRMSAGVGSADEPVTTALGSRASGTAYVTGWLVGKTGSLKGRDYKLSFGWNYIGRSADMDVCIREDRAAAGKYGAVVYDVRANAFFAVAESGELIHVNGEALTGSRQLEAGDEIAIGSIVLEFVPYCREGHTWDIES